MAGSTVELPEDFVAKGLELARGSYIFGKPLMELTREEAIACAAHGWHLEQQAREESSERLQRLLSIRF